MRFNWKSLGLTIGLIWGFGLFFLTWWIILFDGTSESVTFIGRIYRGYTITGLGSVYGLIWGLVDGFVGGAIFAWVYNYFAELFKKSPSITG